MFLHNNFRDGLSLSLGFISLVSWTVAEIPQIVTNYNQKSTRGLSITFLTTWLLGDIFNILGCLMEPATLPTQLYMALGYLLATSILYLQSIYYNHIFTRVENTINLRSAELEDPLLPHENNTKIPSRKSLIYVVSGLSTVLFLGGIFYLTFGTRTMSWGPRKLLNTSVLLEESKGKIGILLGWCMAAIYMGGRIPQIFLNIRRGHVEGLNPLMFMFALLGNVTYIASILVNSVKWFKIAPNLPWLADAGGCAVLDSLILIQYFYFRNKDSSDNNKEKHVTVEEVV
ncbi:unnamed protein product [Cochlearia groenlandica]